MNRWIFVGCLLLSNYSPAQTPTPAATASPRLPASGPDASVKDLIEQLKAPEAADRLLAVQALGSLGPKAKSAAPALSNALTETTAIDHPAVREATRQIAQALSQVDPTTAIAPEVITRLVRRAKQTPIRKRAGTGWITSCTPQSEALETLGFLQASAKAALPDLIRLARKPCVQSHVAPALKLIGEPTAPQLAEILKGLEDPDADVRQATIEYTQGMGGQTPQLIFSLGRALNDSSSAVRLAALEALERLHPEGEGRLPLLAPFLKDSSKEIRERALGIVGLLQSDSKAAIHVLEAALEDTDASIRLTAARDLATRNPRNEKMLTALLALAEPGSSRYDSAVSLLQTIEPRDPRIDKALAPYRAQERAKRVQKAWADSTAQQRYENGRSLRVTSIKMAAEISGDEPIQVDRSFPTYKSPIYCWTEVSVNNAPAALHHVWFHNGKEVKDRYLEVIAPQDRVASREAVKPGKWKVEVRTETSTDPLATINFSVHAEDRPKTKKR